MTEGRMYQDTHFEVDFVKGKVIQAMIALVEVDKPDDHPMIINLKLEGMDWQRYFVDTYAGFWENWATLIDEQEQDVTREVDYGTQYGVVGKSILYARCVNSEIDLCVRGVGSFVLKLVNSAGNDMECEFVVNKGSC